MKAIVVTAYGSPEVLVLQDVPEPVPLDHEALVKVIATGVNYIDVYQRSGLYQEVLPFTPGVEACGQIVQLGNGANALDLHVGDRVAWIGHPGTYAEMATVPVARLIPVHPKLLDTQVAGLLFQGITAQYLTTSTFPLWEGQTALVHAAAGGVGLLLVQLAKRAGARVIGTVSSAEKAALAWEFGCDHVLQPEDGDLRAAVRRASGGSLCDVVYDAVGAATFMASLDCLKPRGTMVYYGQASGLVPPFDPVLLGSKGGLYLTRPSISQYTATRAELLERAQDVQERMAAGELRVHIDRSLPLAAASKAHVALESRATKGKVLLVTGA